MLDDLFDRCDATGVAAAIRAGDVTAREVVETALARIEERNPVINAVTELRAEAALAEADAAAGPLAGVPFVIKDLGVEVAGMRSTNGSRLWADAVAMADSIIVERYRRAGLVIVGTTNVPELGRNASTEPLLHGPTHNPHALDHSPGGSSGGTAAAVAAGLVPAGHGNDGGGSIRLPASMCGLVGLKPTRARTPSQPRLTALAYPLGINHALTRSVRDSALLLDLAAGAIPGDAYLAPPAPEHGYADEVGKPPGRLRIALSTVRPDGSPVDPACDAATRRVGLLLESLGHEVQEATPSYPIDELNDAMRVVMSVPLATDIDTRLAELGRPLADDDLEPFTRVLYDMGRAATGEDYVRALGAVERAGHRLGSFFEEHDLLLTPTIAVHPPALGVLDTTDVQAMYTRAGAYSALTAFANVTGQPAISLPLAQFPDGLPLGVQLVGRFGREDVLIRVAAQLEEAQPWSTGPVWPPRPRAADDGPT